MLHFYKSIRCFNKITEDDDKINFECKICYDKFISPFKNKSNLYKRLKHHKAYLDWKSAYDKCKNKIVKPQIDADTLLLIKFFVSSNVSLLKINI